MLDGLLYVWNGALMPSYPAGLVSSYHGGGVVSHYTQVTPLNLVAEQFPTYCDIKPTMAGLQ